jgi:hypothetical protein
MVVWKSPLHRQHARGTFSEASSPSSRPVSSPAEIQVREIASKIGLFDDSEILATVCHKMRKEYVVEEWQLPALDSRQWEKMHAPIGLAVAVQHISGHRLREQEMQLRFREQYFHSNSNSNSNNNNNNTQTYNENLQKESLNVNKKEEDALVSSLAGSSKQEEEEKSEIVAKTASDDDQDIVQCLALTTSIDTSAITTDEDINDEPNETEKVVTVNENEQGDERNHPPPVSDDVNESDEFSDDCSDWLKLAKVATATDNEGALEMEEECNRGTEATTASPEIDHEDIDEYNGGIDSTKPSVKMAEVALAQANIERVNGIERKIPGFVENKMGATQVETEPVDTLEWENSTASVFVENKQEEAQVGIETINKTERDILTTIEKIIENVQVITEPVHGMEQESSTAPAKIEREQEASQDNSTKQEASQVETKPVESDNDSATIPKHVEQKEIPLVENEYRRDSATASMHAPKNLQEDFDTAKTEEIPETSSSDTELDVDTDIFSGISNSASFSEDEDEPMLADKETTQLGCLLDPIESTIDDTAISSMSKLETKMLLFPENYADDITVAISNVSPELLMLAAKRKKKMKKYRQKLDKGKYCMLNDNTFINKTPSNYIPNSRCNKTLPSI